MNDAMKAASGLGACLLVLALLAPTTAATPEVKPTENGVVATMNETATPRRCIPTSPTGGGPCTPYVGYAHVAGNATVAHGSPTYAGQTSVRLSGDGELAGRAWRLSTVGFVIPGPPGPCGIRCLPPFLDGVLSWACQNARVCTEGPGPRPGLVREHELLP